MSPVDLSLVDLALLTSLHGRGLTSTVPHQNTEAMCRAVAADTGIAEVHCWEAFLTLSRRWEVQHPLIDFQGNIGSPSDPPAEARYTTVRLTRLGEHVAEAADRGEATPMALVVGDVCRGGLRPPLRSDAVVAALGAVIDGASRPEVMALLRAAVAFPTGARTVCDLDTLFSGATMEADIVARIEPTGEREIALSGFPPGVGAEMVSASVASSAHRREPRVIRDVNDHSTVEGERLIVRVVSPDDVAEASEWLVGLWPLAQTRDIGFGSDLMDLLDAWRSQFSTTIAARTRLAAFADVLQEDG